MNVKIKNNNLCFKISNEELNILLEGRPVHTKVDLFDKMLVTTINPNGRGETMEPKLVLDENEVYLNLCIPSTQLQKLLDMGPNRDGLKQQTNDLSIMLQIDMPESCHS